MYHSIAWWIVKKLEHNNVELKNTDSQEICAYGIEITLSTIANYVLLIVIGMLFNSFISSVIFGAVFTTIRHYIGGYHCTTYLRCNITFCGIFTFVLLLGQLLLNRINISVLILILLWSGIGIWYLGPVENKYKPVTENQLKQCHTIAKYIYVVDFAVSVFLYFWKPYYGIVAALTLLSVVVLLPIGIIAERRHNHET